MPTLYNRDREYLINAETAVKLGSSYQVIGDHDIYMEPLTDKDKKMNAFGGKISLFNGLYSVLSDNEFRETMNMPLTDEAAVKERIRMDSDCSIKELVRKSQEGLLGRATFDYSDFMYCKYLGRVSNNYLITLRRFEAPVGDHINHNKLAPDPEDQKGQRAAIAIGRMVTWMGVSGNELSKLLTYSYNQDWQTKNAEWQDNEPGQANMQNGPLASLMNSTDKSYQDSMRSGFVKPYGTFGLKTDKSYDPKDFAPWKDRNRPYGKADIITSTTILGGNDQQPKGITFKQEFDLTFEYEMRSYNGINQKAAFLDLLSNILTTTFTDADFWGGGYRSVGPHATSAYTNLPLFKDSQGGKINNWSDFISSGINSLDEIGKHIAGGKENYSLGDLFKGGLNAIFANLQGGLLNKLGRPHKQMFQSLLKPQPTGVWHLTIGHPQHPILSVGNLYITDCSITHTGMLGIDDFPTGLKVNVKLSHAKPRSNREIEMMYMNGDSRIYHKMNNRYLDIYDTAKKVKRSDKGQNLKAIDDVAVDQASSWLNDVTGNFNISGALQETKLLWDKYSRTTGTSLADTELPSFSFMKSEEPAKQKAGTGGAKNNKTQQSNQQAAKAANGKK